MKVYVVSRDFYPGLERSIEGGIRPVKDLFAYDDMLRGKSFSLLAGVDEVGRGPLAGPVLAAAVVLPQRISIGGLRDSKQLSRRLREKLAQEIKQLALDWAVGLATVREINCLNIHKASLLAMGRAVMALRKVPHRVLVDGRFPITGLPFPQTVIVGGDGLSASIAAASIIAKVARDRIMFFYHRMYPGYGFEHHKGYPTAGHLQKLSVLGPCPIHRTSFAPVKKLKLGI